MLSERPHEYCFSKNEIRYVFDIADPDRAGLFLQVKLFVATMDGAFEILHTFEGLKPTTAGKVVLPIHAYIDSKLRYVLPDITATKTDAGNQLCRFYIHYREVEDATPDPVWTETESANERIAMKGGIEKHKAARNNFFINYFTGAKPFMTWQPANRFIYYDEPVFLTFLNMAGSGFSVNVTIKATDGTEFFIAISHSDADKKLWHIPVGPVALSFASETSKQIWYYEVSVTNNDDETIINPYRFYIDHNPLYESYDLFFFNSISGFDMMRVAGDTGVNYERSTTNAEGGMAVDQWDGTDRAHENAFNSILLQRSYKGNIGIAKTRTRAQQEALIDLLASKAVYMLIDARWIPVISMQQRIETGSRKNRTDGFAIEWQLSEKNEVFTPSKITFGEGSL